MKNQKGVSLITLSIAIIVILIITSMLVYNTQNSIDIKKLENMYNDIEMLEDKISNWYIDYGSIPGKEYNDSNKINEIKSANQLSPNDNDKYYVIDLKVFDNLTLNYGNSYNDIATEDFYIINDQSHRIYYVKGIKSGDILYYTNGIDEEITLYTE